MHFNFGVQIFDRGENCVTGDGLLVRMVTGSNGHWSESHGVEMFLLSSTALSPSKQKSDLAQISKVDSKFSRL